MSLVTRGTQDDCLDGGEEKTGTTEGAFNVDQMQMPRHPEWKLGNFERPSSSVTRLLVQICSGDQSRTHGKDSMTATLQLHAEINLSRVVWKISVVVARASAQALKAGRLG